MLISCNSSNDSESAGVFIPWNEISNPVLAVEDWAVKDACMVFKDSVFYIFAGAFYYEDNGHFASHVVCFRTKDFINFSKPLFIWDGFDDGWLGMASPNITRYKNKYYLTYNSWGDKPGKKNQLFYAVSDDLINWEKDIPLAESITNNLRAIDAAIYFHNEKCFLVYKEFQTPKIAYADSIDSNEWTVLGNPGLGWFENAQLIKIDNDIMLFATIKDSIHGPAISYLEGNPDKPEEWMQWKPLKPLNATIPQEIYNSHEKANAASVADWRKYDGYFYLIGAGTTEGKTFEGRGNCKLGLYRSFDFEEWETPGERDKTDVNR